MNATPVIFGIPLNVLFAVVFFFGVFCFLPVRNTVPCRRRPWATLGLILANAAVWAALLLATLVGGPHSMTAWLNELVFTGDLSRPWTLITSQFIHPNSLQMLLSLWLFYLIGPVLEERLKPAGFLTVYVGGGALTVALHGMLSLSLGSRISPAGMTPAVAVLLGLYLVLHPFDDIVFFYNFLFFAFCGTVLIATIFLVLFAVAVYVICGAVVQMSVLGLGAGPIAHFPWLSQMTPVLGLCVGFLFGTLRYGLGAFVGKSPAVVESSQASRILQRALHRLTATEERPSSPRLSHRERSQSRLALADGAPPEEIEAFAEYCLRNKRHQLLEAAYTRFRARFPNRSFGPGLLSEIALRFEQTDRPALAADACRLLLKRHGETPVATQARLRLARLLARDPTAADETVELLEDFLRRNPPSETADEGRRLLAHIVEQTGRDHTYDGLGPYKPFHFRQPPSRPHPLATPVGAPSPPEGQPIGWSAKEITGLTESSREDTPATNHGQDARATISPFLPTREIVPDATGESLTDWGLQPAGSSEVVAAMAAARSYAVILLPSTSLVADKGLALLSEFWTVGCEEARDLLRRCRGILLDDAPSGRSIVLARKLRNLGLSVTIVPLLPDIIYATSEDVVEFAWNDRACSNVTSAGHRSFGWDQVRLVNLARVGLPGAGAAYRFVLDLFVTQPHCLLRYWENTVNFARSRIGEPSGAADSLLSLVAYLDRQTSRALKTPSFRAVAKKSGPSLDFHSPAELDHYNRWFLYVGFGKYSTGQ